MKTRRKGYMDRVESKPLVSGIIIFLNAEKFIEEAIESVFAQTYENWELLLVDDGSTDASTGIARRYAEQHPGKVRYLEHNGHQNRGKSASRNLGVHHARGEYIAFLDADDIWLPLKLEKQVAILRAQPEAAMVYGPTQHWFSWERNTEHEKQDSTVGLGVQPDTLMAPPRLLIHMLQNEDSCPSTCGILVRREVFENIGGFEEDFRDQCEDLVFYVKVFLMAPVFVMSECWDRYRQHRDNSMSVAIRTGQWHWKKPSPTRQRYLSWVAEYMSQQGVKDAELWKSLQKATWPYRHPILSRAYWDAVEQAKKLLRWIAQRTLPAPAYGWLLVRWKNYGRTGFSNPGCPSRTLKSS